MTRSHPTESRNLHALTELLRRAVSPPSELELERGLKAVKLRKDRVPSRKTRRWAYAAATLVTALAFVVLGVSFYSKPSSVPERPVAVDKIEGGRLLDGGYLSEVGHSGITLLFNEGSKFQLSPGTRGRLRDVTPEGARFALEHGTASFQITVSPDHRWSVEAGPFVVVVRGTEFAVDWDPEREELEVSLRRGRVTVSGPIVGDELILRPGQVLTVSLPRGETVIKEGNASAKPHTIEAPRTAGADEASKADEIAETPRAAQERSEAAPPASASASPPRERSWKEAIATGQWDRILADIDRDGLSTLGTLSSEDLLALADAARYRRRTDLARAALLEQRRRFPASPRSLDALFLLGRVEEAGQKALAIRHYDEYLARAPGGTYAAEALGRRMILTKDVEGPARAAQVAEDYVRRFPNGSYAKAARALRQVP